MSVISAKLQFISHVQSPRRACCCTVRRELGRRCAPGPSPTGRTPASSASSDQNSYRSKLSCPTVLIFFGLFFSYGCMRVRTSAHLHAKRAVFRVRHRVGRVLSFFSSRRNWDSLNPSPAGERIPPPPPPPLVPRGGAHSLAREGVGESQFRRGDILYTVLPCKYTYFVVLGIKSSGTVLLQLIDTGRYLKFSLDHG